MRTYYIQDNRDVRYKITIDDKELSIYNTNQIILYYHMNFDSKRNVYENKYKFNKGYVDKGELVKWDKIISFDMNTIKNVIRPENISKYVDIIKSKKLNECEENEEEEFYYEDPRGTHIVIEFKDGKYIYVGCYIMEFRLLNEIKHYFSPICNNAVEYPFIIDIDNNVYLLVEQIIIKKCEEKIRDFYHDYYSYQRENKNKKKKEDDKNAKKYIKMRSKILKIK